MSARKSYAGKLAGLIFLFFPYDLLCRMGMVHSRTGILMIRYPYQLNSKKKFGY